MRLSKLNLVILLFFLILSHLNASDIEARLESLFEEILSGDKYLEIKGSGYLISEFESGRPEHRHSEWQFTTILNINPINPRIYVSFEPMTHAVFQSVEKRRINRKVWFDGDVWLYTEQLLDDELSPLGVQVAYLDDEVPAFMGDVDRDGDFFGLTFIPWRYGIISNYSLFRSIVESSKNPFSIHFFKPDENLLSVQFKNSCNETIVLFDDRESEPLRMHSVEEVYNLCSGGQGSGLVATAEFSNFLVINGMSDNIAFPTEFSKTYSGEDGKIHQKRFGKLESVRIVPDEYVNQIFQNKENVSGLVIFDKINDLIIYPNGDVRPSPL